MAGEKEKGLKEGITRRQSSELQGIAILLMFFHHFFMEMPSDPTPWFLNPGLAVKLAWFGKICVALFAFVSGYGMYYVLQREEKTGFFRGLRKDYRTVLRQLFAVYRKYWLIFALFPGIELLTGARPFEPKEFFLNFFAVSTTYQATWWYMGQYAVMLLLLPLIDMLFARFAEAGERKRKYLFFGLLLLAGAMWAVCGLTACRPLWELLLRLVEALRLSFLLPFCVGYLLARCKAYQWLARRIRGKAAVITAVVALAAAVTLRVFLADSPAYARADFVVVPVFVYAVLILLQFVPPLETVLAWLGRQSTYMWLIHGFLYEEIGTWLIGGLHSGWLVYGVMLILSAVLAWLLNGLFRQLRTRQQSKKALDKQKSAGI